MNPNIILAGQTPDIAGAGMRGVQLAQGVNDTRRTNALRGLYQQQGAQMLAGDQGALNALAGFDPAAALGIQGARQDMQFAQNRENRAAQQFQMALSQMSQADAKAEADKLRAAIGNAAAAQTPEQWDAYVTSIGQNELVGQFANREAVLLQYMNLTEYIEAEKGLKDIRGGGEATFRPATPDEAAQYGAKAGQIDEKTGRFYPNNPPSGMTVRTTPDGGVELVQGPGVGGGMDLTTTNKTDAQRSSIAYQSIMEGIDAYEKIFQDGGPAVMPGAQRDALIAARRDLQLQMKELFNLGVLNGPDLELMDSLLVDPTSIGNVALDTIGAADLGKRVESNLQQVRDQLTRLIGPKLDAIGSPRPTGQQPRQEPSAQSRTVTLPDGAQYTVEPLD